MKTLKTILIQSALAIVLSIAVQPAFAHGFGGHFNRMYNHHGHRYRGAFGHQRFGRYNFHQRRRFFNRYSNRFYGGGYAYPFYYNRRGYSYPPYQYYDGYRYW